MNDQRTLPEMKPCPFCGGKAVLRVGGGDYPGGDEIKQAMVYCTKCGATGQGVQVWLRGQHNSAWVCVVAAVNAWNRRTEG